MVIKSVIISAILIVSAYGACDRDKNVQFEDPLYLNFGDGFFYMWVYIVLCPRGWIKFYKVMWLFSFMCVVRGWVMVRLLWFISIPKIREYLDSIRLRMRNVNMRPCIIMSWGANMSLRVSKKNISEILLKFY